MKNYLFFALIAVITTVSSCNRSAYSLDFRGGESGEPFLGHGEIILGEQLENPYTVEAVKSAFKAVYPGRSDSDISSTDLYVRFLPENDEQMDILTGLEITILDHPIDYLVVQEGDYYHDPEISKEDITWQYAVVPVDFSFPDGIKYEILDECYIAENDTRSKASLSDVDWEAVEREAFVRTGNEDMLIPQTKGGSAYPSGRITISDPSFAANQPFGVAEVKVSCNVFVKFASAWADRDGYYNIPKKFSANPRYRLVFKNRKGFSIGFNSILYPASVSTLGKNSVEGVDCHVTQDSDRALFRRCVVNNAAYDYFSRCGINDLDITAPPSNLCMWCFDNSTASSAIMLHHGTILPQDSANIIFKLVAWTVKFFAPDITLGTQGQNSYKDLYHLVIHELAHASHFSAVGVDYWNRYILYIAECALLGQDLYGDGTLDRAGYCEVGEMWAYYMESKLFKDRYRTANPAYGSTYWFRPYLLTYLEDRGITTGQIFKALSPDVTSRSALKDRLIKLYPSKTAVINQVFDRYE